VNYLQLCLGFARFSPAPVFPIGFCCSGAGYRFDIASLALVQYLLGYGNGTYIGRYLPALSCGRKGFSIETIHDGGYDALIRALANTVVGV